MTEIRANPKRTYALIVGIEKYKDGSLPDVNGPASDAIEFAKWLSKRGVPKKNIFLCISLLEENQGLLEKLELEFQEATQTNVWNLLTESLHKKEGDLLLIFWVGHGIIDSEERKRRLFFADATINNGQNLYLESLLESIKSTYFQIQHQICIIDACAVYLREDARPLDLGGQRVPSGEPNRDWRQFRLFSAREGEKSLICQERKTSYFCEALREELIASSNSLWPPNMEVIVRNLKERFEELRKQGKVEQIPIRHVDVQTWDGDRHTLFEKGSSDLLATNVRQTSNAAREALEPRYLQRISRQVVQEKYLPAIQRGVEGEARVIFIYAPAGYGKSVILGEIYDQLIQSSDSWVALTLCAYLSRKSIDSIQSLAEVLGESVCFKKEPIDEIALTLSDRYSRRGVLLIDTLDLILNSDLIPNLHGVLLKLLNVGVTVVFTCREEEYKFLRSSDANLGGIKLDHHKVAEFIKKEVEEAALKFIEKKKEAKREENKEQEVNDQIFTNFADQIFNIAAGEYRASDLHKIIQNPLLLGMLCELFAEKGNVPPDLTVSNLYDKYWDEKVYNHRLLGENSFEAEQKQRLCLAIAKGFFNIFREDLTFNESAEKYDLGIDWHKDFIAAFQDLVTEGVLETLPTDKNQIRFFHQTLLEYAIARWLKLREAQLSLNGLLDDLKQIDWAYSQLYWYTIIRQILTIATNSKFEDIVKQLEIRKQQPAFRAVVFAAASRDEPSALQNLLPLALELESSHQEALHQAVVSASVKLADSAYDIMLDFMQKGKIKPAINAAQTAGAMLARWWSSLSPRLEETLEAINKRTILHEKNKLSPEHYSDIFGWFFKQFKAILEQTVDINALCSLRKYYYLAGYKNLSFLIQLHLRLEVPKEERRQLLNLLVRESIPNKLQIKEDIENLLEDVLPDLVKPEELVQWGSWLAALDPNLEELPKGWDEVQGKIVGRLVSNKLERLKEILKNAFENTQSNIYCNIQAIETAVQRGGGSSVATILLSTNIEAIPPERYGSLDKLLRNTASYFSLDNQEAIARWLEPVARNSPEKFIPALDALADNSPFARQLYAELIPKLPSKQQAYQQARLLRFCPIEQHPPLTGFDQKSQLFLVALYRQHAKTSTQALQKLLEVVRGIISAKVVYQDVVYQALEDIETLAVGRLGIKDWLPLLRAEFPKARIKSLEAISQMKQELTDTELTEICLALATEDNQQVVIRLCKLVKLWVNTNKRVPLNVTEAICGIPSRLSQKNTFDGGVAEVLIPTITAIAQSDEQTLIPQQLVEGTRILLMEIDVHRGKSRSNVINLLCAVDRLDENFLPLLVSDDCPELAENRWEENLCVIVNTIGRTKKLYLLDSILNLARVHHLLKVEEEILKLKGA